MICIPEPIEIVFLGTGAAIPTLQRKQAAILLRRAGGCFLFDCGEGAQLGLIKAKISPLKISKIFITHWHADHFAGLLPLLETLHLLRRQEPLEVYGPEAGRFIDALLELSYWGVGFDLRPVDVDTGVKKEIFRGNDFSILSIPTKHNVPSVGYMLQESAHWKLDMTKLKKYGLQSGPELKGLKETGVVVSGKKVLTLEELANKMPGRKFAYSGDTFAYEPFFREVAGADLLVHDGTFVEPLEGRAHASVKEVALLAKKYKVKKLVLTHISRRYQDTAQFLKIAKKTFKETVIAKDGMRIII